MTEVEHNNNQPYYTYMMPKYKYHYDIIMTHLKSCNIYCIVINFDNLLIKKNLNINTTNPACANFIDIELLRELFTYASRNGIILCLITELPTRSINKYIGIIGGFKNVINILPKSQHIIMNLHYISSNFNLYPHTILYLDAEFSHTSSFTNSICSTCSTICLNS